MKEGLIVGCAREWLRELARGDMVRVQQLSWQFDDLSPCGYEQRKNGPVFTYHLPNSKRRVVSRQVAIEAWARVGA